jgi:Arc/MetJ-type ribon-helix-helix transcriptional regulator
MDIRLRPDLEQLIQQDLQRGPYQSVDEYLEHAITLLHQQETWFAEHASEINSKISQGLAAARRGELLDAEQVQSILEQKKRAWLAK